MHAISIYRGNRPTHKQTDRTDYNTLRHSFANTWCNQFISETANSCVEIRDNDNVQPLTEG